MDTTLAHAVYLDSSLSAVSDLGHVGSSHENPYVYDAMAREFIAMAGQGLVEIVEQRAVAVGDDTLIGHLRFRRLR